LEIWFSEKHTDNLALHYRIKETLFRKKTPYQELAILDTCEFGRTLVLDGVVQTTVRDEFIYHEMLVHPAMALHPSPQRILVVGGGDGGTIREIVKYPGLEKVTLAELDEEVIAASRHFLPELSCAFDHPKVEISIGDGVEYIKDKENTFDIIFIDSPDPIGPASGLFSAAFYADIRKALKPEGIMVAQTESPFLHAELIRQVHAVLRKESFSPRLYLAYIPTYQHGMWSFTMALKEPGSLKPEPGWTPPGTRYYNKDIHRGALSLPSFVAEIVAP